MVLKAVKFQRVPPIEILMLSIEGYLPWRMKHYIIQCNGLEKSQFDCKWQMVSKGVNFWCWFHHVLLRWSWKKLILFKCSMVLKGVNFWWFAIQATEMVLKEVKFYCIGNGLERGQFAQNSLFLPNGLERSQCVLLHCLLPLGLAVLSILYSDAVPLYLWPPCINCLRGFKHLMPMQGCSPCRFWPSSNALERSPFSWIYFQWLICFWILTWTICHTQWSWKKLGVFSWAPWWSLLFCTLWRFLLCPWRSLCEAGGHWCCRSTSYLALCGWG